MSQSKFEIVKPISNLPPSKVKILPYSGVAQEIDIFQKFQSVGVGLIIVNSHASNTMSVSIDGQPTITVRQATTLPLNDIQFGLINVTGTGTGQIIIKQLSKLKLIKDNLIEVD